MLDLQQLLSFYPERLHPFRTNILREYLQFKILESLGSSPLAAPLVFMGGTCIHLVHGNPRFSEDLDFDNRGLSAGDFDQLSQSVADDLAAEGYSVELKTSQSGAFHAFFRFTHILQESGLTGHREEKLLIRIDTEPQRFDYLHDDHILNRFDVFQRIKVVPADILLAQKLDCIFSRNRPMGRDFFDTVFLMGKTRPSFEYLKQKLDIDSEAELNRRLLARCVDLDFRQLARDIEPFIFSRDDTKKVLLFREFVETL